MATLTIRRIDDEVKTKLRLRAASRSRSMEEEVREILKAAVAVDQTSRLNLAASIRRHLTGIGGVDLQLPPREPIRNPPDFAN